MEDDDPIVQKKFVENLVQMQRTGIVLMAMALFLRLMAVQAPLLRTGTISHNLQPSLDVSNMISYPLCALIAIFPQVLASWNLDFWYIVMQTLCVFPLFLTQEEDVLNVSLITAFPRLLCGLGARTGILPILGNLVNCAAATYLSHEEGKLLAFTAELCMVFSGFISIRYMLHQNVVMTGRLKTRTIDLGAVSQLLLGFCDAVVEIDSSLKLTEDSRQLSTLLLHNQGMTSDGLAGRDFLSFFCTEDRGRIKESLLSGSSHTMALNARMMDCLGSNLQMEVVHCHFDNANGQRCCLVGMREFQDFGYSIAPLLEEVAEKDSTLANNLQSSGPEGAPTSLKVTPEASVPEDATVLFNADTFDILNMGGGFGQLCSRANLPANDLDGVASIFDLSKTTGPSSFGRQLQEAINSWDEAAPKATHLANVDLLGSIFLDLDLLLQKDSVLEHLVGTLQVTRVIPPELSPSAKLTQSNLARFAGRSVRRSRPGSRGSHRSRSSKRSDGSERPMHQGSILELRTPRLAL